MQCSFMAICKVQQIVNSLELIYFPNNTFKCLSVNLYVSEKDCPNIKHSFDVWHGTKNLGK